MGEGLGNAIEQAIMPLAIVFLIGFTIVLFTLNLIFRSYKGRPLRSDPLGCIFALMASVLGGCLVIYLLL